MQICSGLTGRRSSSPMSGDWQKSPPIRPKIEDSNNRRACHCGQSCRLSIRRTGPRCREYSYLGARDRTPKTGSRPSRRSRSAQQSRCSLRHPTGTTRAEEPYQQALAVREKVLSQDHPDLALHRSMHEIGTRQQLKAAHPPAPQNCALRPGGHGPRRRRRVPVLPA